jgi:UDP-N-acetylglucosamine transferase subunit ALG13/peptidoglycan/LPS O-acetylase OafA/YrhL
VIFLTVGTWRAGFDRLVRGVDELVATGVVKDEVIAQVGHGSYRPSHLQAIDFCSPGEMAEYIKEARLVIAHAGMGTIIQTLEQDTPLVAVPRKAEFGEVDNDHQFSTARQLEEEGKILVAYEVEQLGEKIAEAGTFTPVTSEGTSAIHTAVQDLLDGLVQKRSGRRGSGTTRRSPVGNSSSPATTVSGVALAECNGTARAIAILLVVLAHMKYAGPFWTALGPFTSAGKLGVGIFVFYAGLLHRLRFIQRGDQWSASSWLRRRLAGVYPAYWGGLALSLIVGIGWRDQEFSVGALTSNLLGIAVVTQSQIVTAGYARPFWFISLILLCYLFFMGVRKTRRTGVVVVVAFGISALAAGIGVWWLNAASEYFLAVIAFPAFAMGMWVADASERKPLTSKLWRDAVLFLLFLGVSAAVFKNRAISSGTAPARIGLIVLGTLAITPTVVYSVFLVRRLHHWLRQHTWRAFNAVALVGALSYYIYCVHEPLLVVLDWGGRVVTPLGGLVLYVSLVGLMAGGLRLLVSDRWLPKALRSACG